MLARARFFLLPWLDSQFVVFDFAAFPSCCSDFGFRGLGLAFYPCLRCPGLLTIILGSFRPTVFHPVAVTLDFEGAGWTSTCRLRRPGLLPVFLTDLLFFILSH
jgi:hypothetical protein